MLASAFVLAAAVPATAGTSIHFYTFENPARPTKTRTIDVVGNNATANEHQIGTCKNIKVGRDFYNESGRIVQLHRRVNCADSNPTQLADGEQIHASDGFQSVIVI
ncbi:hypothetical protein ADL27_48485 [Streptomyces sp. NRRL F-6602]|nr:hypothetical protein ADL27_48485 [Streptomyces sp. NRRL F-6602]